MLGRPNRNQLGNGIDAQEMVADFFHLSEFGLNMFFTQVADVQPEVIAIRAFDSEPLLNMMGHPAGNHVSGCQLFLFRFILGHKPFFVHI